MIEPDEVMFKEDIDRFRREIPELQNYPDRIIAKLYHCFSEEMYCAGWLMLDKDGHTVKQFKDWLLIPNLERLAKQHEGS